MGCGLMARDLKMIKKLIPEEIFTAFDDEYSAGNVLEFRIYNALARCGECRRIFTANAFSYSLKCDGGSEDEIVAEDVDEDAGSDTGQDADPECGEPPLNEIRYIEECPCCGGVSAEEEDIEKIVCPRCRRKMSYQSIGHWD